jgi:hypothetical protein
MSAHQCEVPVEILINPPFSLPWGSDVYAKVIATNVYGDSLESPVGNGAKIITYPDVPVNFADDLSQRTSTAIGLKWEDGADGGS